MKFQFKIITWEQVLVADADHEQEILELIKTGKIKSAGDIFDYLAEKGDMNAECEKLTETDQQLTPEENNGYSTIEVWEGESVIFQNGKNIFV